MPEEDVTQEQEYDFVGYATKYDVRCTDGRTIKSPAFSHQDGGKVALVWRHLSENITNIVGHAILKHVVGKGIQVFGYFNDTVAGVHAKRMVLHGDVDSLSINAIRVKEDATGNVFDGLIREVSLAMLGANPGAKIEAVMFHSEDGDPYGFDRVPIEGEYVIYSGEKIDVSETALNHEAGGGETVGDVVSTMTDDQKEMLGYMLDEAAGVLKQSDGTGKAKGPTLQEVYETLTDKQKIVVEFLVGVAVKNKEDLAKLSHSDQNQNGSENLETGDNNMPKENDNNDGTQNPGQGTEIKHNVFEITKDSGRYEAINQLNTMLHAAKDGQASLKAVVMANENFAHGITNIDTLFPEAKDVRGGAPLVYDDDNAWVSTVYSGVRKTPFSRVKSSYADLTLATARARGYVKGDQKLEQIFDVANRTTTPQTIYTLHKLDRDDIIDITSFDVVVFLKAMMRAKLREELARAILIGDGRLVTDPDKIKEANVRPVMTDDDFYAHKYHMAFGITNTEVVDHVMRGRQYYRGKGSPTFFTSPTQLTDLLLIRDADGRRLYRSVNELASEMRVGNIVEVPDFEGLQTPEGENVIGISLSLRDFVIGADRGGQTSFFDDFNLDFNKYTYLLETRVSGALVTPKSAIVYSQPTS